MFLNPKIGPEWFRRWATEMKPVIVTDARQAAEWIAIGRFPIGLFGTATQAERMAAQGLPIRGWLPWQMAEGAVLSASAANIMGMDHAPDPNARDLFINWALSKDAQALFIKIGKKTDSLRRDVPDDTIEPQYRIDPKADYYVPFSDDNYINHQDEALAKSPADHEGRRLQVSSQRSAKGAAVSPSRHAYHQVWRTDVHVQPAVRRDAATAYAHARRPARSSWPC